MARCGCSHSSVTALSIMCRSTLLHFSQVNVRRSWPNPPGSIAVNVIGESQSIHCGLWFCILSMSCFPGWDTDERFSPGYSGSIIVHFWATHCAWISCRGANSPPIWERTRQGISRAMANSWAQTCHESASLARYFKCQRGGIYGSLAKGPSISVSIQLQRGLGSWHGGIVGGARVHSAARLHFLVSSARFQKSRATFRRADFFEATRPRRQAGQTTGATVMLHWRAY